jgi:hypothetical protein
MNYDARIEIEQVLADPTWFFEGKVEAHGFVTDRKGRVRRQFRATFDGQRDAKGISITEVLTYTDGGVDHRVWRIEPDGADRFLGKADGLATPILIQRVSANETRWTYKMDIVVGSSKVRLDFEDIMVQGSRDMMTSSTPITKFGIRLGHIATSYRRVG